MTTPDITTPDITTPDITTPDITTPDMTTLIIIRASGVMVTMAAAAISPCSFNEALKRGDSLILWKRLFLFLEFVCKIKNGKPR